MSVDRPAYDPELEARIVALPEPDLTDPDNPEWTEDDFARARPPEELFTLEELEATFPRTAERVRKARGAQKAPTKRLVSLRLSPAVIEHYKAGGPGWQSRIDAALLATIEAPPRG